MANTRIGTPVNLENGGTHDLLIMGFPNGFPRGYVSFEIGDTPRRITGVQKVVQTFLYTLMTSFGSDPIRPSAGTYFNDYAAGSNIGSDPEELNRLMRDFIRQAEAQTVQTLTSSKEDLSSQLEKVEILFVNSQKDAITLGLKVITRAGDTTSIAVPFPQADLFVNAV